MELIGKDEMILALKKLNEKLAQASEYGEIIIFGGATMCLVYGNRVFARDIDAVFEPKSNIYQYTQEIAQELSLPKDWINDGVKGWLYADPERIPVFDFDHLKVFVAAPEYILAMKCHAARQDTDDRNDLLFWSNI